MANADYRVGFPIDVLWAPPRGDPEALTESANVASVIDAMRDGNLLKDRDYSAEGLFVDFLLCDRTGFENTNHVWVTVNVDHFNTCMKWLYHCFAPDNHEHFTRAMDMIVETASIPWCPAPSDRGRMRLAFSQLGYDRTARALGTIDRQLQGQDEHVFTDGASFAALSCMPLSMPREAVPEDAIGCVSPVMVLESEFTTRIDDDRRRSRFLARTTVEPDPAGAPFRDFARAEAAMHDFFAGYSAGGRNMHLKEASTYSGTPAHGRPTDGVKGHLFRSGKDTRKMVSSAILAHQKDKESVPACFTIFTVSNTPVRNMRDFEGSADGRPLLHGAIIFSERNYIAASFPHIHTLTDGRIGAMHTVLPFGSVEFTVQRITGSAHTVLAYKNKNTENFYKMQLQLNASNKPTIQKFFGNPFAAVYAQKEHII